MEDIQHLGNNRNETAYPQGEQTTEERQMGALVRMHHRRLHSTEPDLGKAWETFRHAHISRPPHTAQSSQRRFSAWHLTAAATLGAAAMLALVFLFSGQLFHSSSEALHKKEVVALQHDNTPQRVKLEEETITVDLTLTDSISYQSATYAATAVPPRTAPKKQRLSTPRGMAFKVVLPDGSEVQLNAESTIEFPTAFQDGERRVKLRGEAYFKIARNENAPFIVTSDQLSVRVLGTEFNFKSYVTETAHVSLVKGKVEVMRPGTETSDATLKPGEEAWYDETGTLRIQEVDTYAVTQWVNGFFYFHDQPLVKVLCELGRWYNLGVLFQNTEALHYKVHFSALRNDPVNVALESLNRLRHIRVRIEGDNIVVY